MLVAASCGAGAWAPQCSMGLYKSGHAELWWWRLTVRYEKLVSGVSSFSVELLLF